MDRIIDSTATDISWTGLAPISFESLLGARMDAFAEYLYSEFLYRDVLSYAVPGFIVLFSLLYAIKGTCLPLVDALKNSKMYFAGFAFAAYLAGLSIQAIGTIGSQADWWPLLRFYPSSHLSSSTLAFALEDAEFNAIAVVVTKPEERATRLERFGALRQVHGNLAAALFVLGLCILGRSIYARDNLVAAGWVSVSVIVVAAILWSEHRNLIIKEQVWRELMMEAKSKSPSIELIRGHFTPILEQLRSTPDKNQIDQLETFISSFEQREFEALSNSHTPTKKD
jgi:hypothetical protein